MPLTSQFAGTTEEIAQWRHELHAHPELDFDTHRTSGFVVDKLSQFGCDRIETGIGRTGVVAVICGHSTSSGRVVGLRADMDALPIHEESGVAYASTQVGRMHACGHDGHTAMLLGAAKYLAQTRNFNGTVAVIFQPAEEGGGGGREMVNDGLMEKFEIDQVFGLHNFPGLEVGKFAIAPGAFLASVDNFEIALHGKGGHAAFPHLGVDTALMASQIVCSLQTIVSRNINPSVALVVTVTAIEMDTESFNIIPDRARLKGTVRALNEKERKLAEQRLTEIASKTAEAAGGVATIKYTRTYPVLQNWDNETRFAIDVASQLAGEANVDGNAPPVMGAEDFAFMLERRPGAYILMGNGETSSLHHPKYDFNDDAIAWGCSYWAQLAEKSMPIS